MKILFKKKNYKISFELELLPKVACLDHVGDSMANAIVLNNNFTISLNLITAILDNDIVYFAIMIFFLFLVYIY